MFLRECLPVQHGSGGERSDREGDFMMQVAVWIDSRGLWERAARVLWQKSIVIIKMSCVQVHHETV